MARKKKVAPPLEVLAQLKQMYPDAHCALDHRNAFELLIATVLSAQCTDARVNLTTPALFARYPDALSMARAPIETIEGLIKPTGFYRNKAKAIAEISQAIVTTHAGEVPRTMVALTAMRGVGRKTANVVLGNAFGLQEGIVVDTHVGRLARRLGWTKQEDPVKVEQDLMEWVPREDWALVSHLLISHGRALCQARKPSCSDCALANQCPSELKASS